MRSACGVCLSGMGSRWDAGLRAGPLFSMGGRPVYVQGASELLQFATIPSDAVIIAISRPGRSVEIVRLLAKARKSGTVVIGVTNSEDGPLAQEAQIPIVVAAKLDHGISVNTYSTLAAATGALASVTLGFFDDALAASLSRAVAETARSVARWRDQREGCGSFLPGSACYFLARGSHLGI